MSTLTEKLMRVASSVLRAHRGGAILAVALLVVFFGAASALAATTAGPYTLRVGDYARVADARGFDGVICYRAPNAVPVESIKCYVADQNGIKPLSYFGFVTSSSTVVYRVDTQGEPHVVWQRPNVPSGPSGMASAPAQRGEGMLAKTTLQREADEQAAFGRAYTLALGDTAVVAGSSVHCFNDPTASPPGAVSCYIHDGASKSGVLVGSYSILIDWHDITVWKAKADGTFTRVYAHLEPTA